MPTFILPLATRNPVQEETISTRAHAALLFFHKGPDDEMAREAWYVEREAPEWIRDLTYAGHADGTVGGQLPNDERYAFIVEALDALSNTEDADEARDSLEPDVYTHNLTAWLASRNDRYGYVDEACEEMGAGPDTETFARLQMGQLREMQEVFDAVRGFLQEQADEINETQESAREAFGLD